MAEVPADRTKEELMAEAEKRGITGLTSRSTKQEVWEALETDGYSSETPPGTPPTPDDTPDEDDDGEDEDEAGEEGATQAPNPHNQGLSMEAGDPPNIVMGGRHPDETNPDSPQTPQVEPLPAVRAGQRDSLAPAQDEVEFTDENTVTNQSDHYKEVVVEGHGRFGVPSGASLDLSSREVIEPGKVGPPEDAPAPEVPEGPAIAAETEKIAAEA